MKNVEKSKKKKKNGVEEVGEVTHSRHEKHRTYAKTCRENVARGGLEYFRFHRKTSCSLPSSFSLLFVCLGYSTRHPRVCHSSSLLPSWPIHFVFSSRSRIFLQFNFFFLPFSSSPPRLHDWVRRNPDQWGGEASHSLSKRGVSFLFLSHRRDPTSYIS